MRNRPARGRSPAFALVLVLSFLVLITVLVVAFFFSVTTELSGSKSYADQAISSQLADTVVQTVMATVQEATACDSTIAWASQPGMIRNYDTNGNPVAYYKLYSSDNAIVTQSTVPAIGTPGTFDPASDVADDWSEYPALFTDLNAPVVSDNNALLYPILDPTVLDNPATAPQGFSIVDAPVSTTLVNDNPAPMPVRWLYLLKDGSLTAPTSGSHAQASWSGGSVVPTTENPIVGRVAFWTDDDSCKVNINTAAGDVWTDGSALPGQPGNPGSFWDTPRVNSAVERNLAKFQPAKNEFQRYPGHPATTYLSSVFPALTPSDIYSIAARVALGGSKSGTTVATAATPIATPPDTDRLYASVDELMFKVAGRSENAPLAASQVQKSKFFLTAHSRSPEVSLLNQPRVGIWPIGVSANSRTAFDNLIAHCGTLNSFGYYFQRSDPAVATKDLPATPASIGLGRNREVMAYLRRVTGLPIPGFSGAVGDTFLAKYPNDRDQILTEIFDYIRALNSQDTSITGVTPFTVVSASTLGTTGQGQIVPISDDVHSDSNDSQALRGFGRFPTVREASLMFVGVGQTQGVNKSLMPTATVNPNASPIADGTTRVQAVFLLNFFEPSQGYAASVPNFRVRIKNLDKFRWNGSSLGLTADGTITINRNFNTGLYGGYKGASSFIQGSGFNASCISITKDFPSTTAATASSFSFTGTDIDVEIQDPAGTVVQTLKLNFPDAMFPVPELAPMLRDPGSPSPSTNKFNFDYRILRVSALAAHPSINSRFGGSGTNTSATTSGKMWACSKDVIRSVVANTDPRLIAARKVVDASFFSPIDGYSDPTVKQAHAIAEALNGGGCYAFVGARLGKFVKDANYGTPEGAGGPAPIPPATSDLTYIGTEADNLQPTAGQVAGNYQGLKGYSAPVAFGISGGKCVPVNGVGAGTNQTGSAISNRPPGDWDTGMSLVGDGAYINKADEGSISNLASGSIAYFEGLNIFTNAGGTFFSPNRQMPSAVMFGSLPTGVFANRPWQTLLFHPESSGTPQHLGATSPKDHLLLDLFTMPVVEPYAVSDPFSTAGRVNMNYEIAPFSYIKRSTALRAVLRSEQILALNNSDAATYKQAGFANRRIFLNLDETLQGFEDRFGNEDIFRSASEICELWLVPRGTDYDDMETFWSSRQLTGDNVRERPYANIYPRLTTKSNTYTVHYRVQTLKKARNSPANQWNEGRDQVTAEYRGSTSFERYLDTEDRSIPDYATNASAVPLYRFYKTRIIESSQFAP